MRFYLRTVHCLKISQGYASNFITLFRCYVLAVVQISNNTVQYRNFEIGMLSARNFSRFLRFFEESQDKCFAAKKVFAYHYVCISLRVAFGSFD